MVPSAAPSFLAALVEGSGIEKDSTPTEENNMEKKVQTDMETGMCGDYSGGCIVI